LLSQAATLSNCGDVLKLETPTMPRNRAWGQGNDLGYGKSALDETMDNPQPSPTGVILWVQFTD